jgi:hypothetical protein
MTIPDRPTLDYATPRIRTSTTLRSSGRLIACALVVVAASITVGSSLVAQGHYSGAGYMPGNLIQFEALGTWIGAAGLLLFLIEYARGWRSRDE